MDETKESLPHGIESNVRKVQAPDGSTFDMLRQGPGVRGPGEEGSAELRGNALVEMKSIVESREPQLLPDLNMRMSYEYMSSSAITHSKKPDVKADLVRVAVREDLAEGHRWDAVHMLAYANAAELDLPEYGEDFVKKQFNLARISRPKEAWMIASEMVRKLDKIIKPQDEDDKQRILSEWTEREERAFREHAEVTLAQAKMPGTTELSLPDMRFIFWHMRHRRDGFNSENPSELSRSIAETMIAMDLNTEGREWTALIDAAEARMPDDYIAELKKKIDPDDINKARNWFSKLREKLGKVLGKT